jgi:hypothetical protein
MPPCPQFRKTVHSLYGWKILTGQGDAVKDPYPEKSEKPGIKSAEVIKPASKK